MQFISVKWITQFYLLRNAEHFLDKIKKYKKNIKINYISSPIMNQLSYNVSNAKICEKGLKLKNSIDSDVKDTIKLLDNI